MIDYLLFYRSSQDHPTFNRRSLINITILPLDNLNKIEHKEFWYMSIDESTEFMAELRQ